MTTCILHLDTLVLGTVASAALILAGAMMVEASEPASKEPVPHPTQHKLAVVAGLAAGCILLVLASVVAAVMVNK